MGGPERRMTSEFQFLVFHHYFGLHPPSHLLCFHSVGCVKEVSNLTSILLSLFHCKSVKH
jgi:hypothetical protein